MAYGRSIHDLHPPYRSTSGGSVVSAASSSASYFTLSSRIVIGASGFHFIRAERSSGVHA